MVTKMYVHCFLNVMHAHRGLIRQAKTVPKLHGKKTPHPEAAQWSNEKPYIYFNFF